MAYLEVKSVRESGSNLEINGSGFLTCGIGDELFSSNSSTMHSTPTGTTSGSVVYPYYVASGSNPAISGFLDMPLKSSFSSGMSNLASFVMEIPPSFSPADNTHILTLASDQIGRSVSLYLMSDFSFVQVIHTQSGSTWSEFSRSVLTKQTPYTINSGTCVLEWTFGSSVQSSVILLDSDRVEKKSVSPLVPQESLGPWYVSEYSQWVQSGIRGLTVDAIGCAKIGKNGDANIKIGVLTVYSSDELSSFQSGLYVAPATLFSTAALSSSNRLFFDLGIVSVSDTRIVIPKPSPLGSYFAVVVPGSSPADNMVVLCPVGEESFFKANDYSLRYKTPAAYVSPLGNDITGNGSFVNPFKTIEYAQKKYTRNSLIILGAGNYSPRVPLKSCRIVGPENAIVSNVVLSGNIFQSEGVTINGFDSGSSENGSVKFLKSKLSGNIVIRGHNNVSIHSCSSVASSLSFDIDCNKLSIINTIIDNGSYTNLKFKSVISDLRHCTFKGVSIDGPDDQPIQQVTGSFTLDSNGSAEVCPVGTHIVSAVVSIPGLPQLKSGDFYTTRNRIYLIGKALARALINGNPIHAIVRYSSEIHRSCFNVFSGCIIDKNNDLSYGNLFWSTSIVGVIGPNDYQGDPMFDPLNKVTNPLYQNMLLPVQELVAKEASMFGFFDKNGSYRYRGGTFNLGSLENPATKLSDVYLSEIGGWLEYTGSVSDPFRNLTTAMGGTEYVTMLLPAYVQDFSRRESFFNESLIPWSVLQVKNETQVPVGALDSAEIIGYRQALPDPKSVFVSDRSVTGDTIATSVPRAGTPERPYKSTDIIMGPVVVLPGYLSSNYALTGNNVVVATENDVEKIGSYSITDMGPGTWSKAAPSGSTMTFRERFLEIRHNV